MCDIGFCVAKIVSSDIDQAMPCIEACSFNLKQVVKTVKKEKMVFTVKGKRKQY